MLLYYLNSFQLFRFHMLLVQREFENKLLPHLDIEGSQSDKTTHKESTGPRTTIPVADDSGLSRVVWFFRTILLDTTPRIHC